MRTWRLAVLILVTILTSACPKPVDPEPTGGGKTGGGVNSTGGGSGQSAGGTTGSGGGGEVAIDCVEPSTFGTPLRLLTRVEYNNTVRDLLGDTSEPANDFPREPLAHGLDNNADLNKVSSDGLTRYLESAEVLSKDALSNRRELVVPCSTEDSVCSQKFLDTFGLKAFRRPLSPDERQSLTALFDEAQLQTQSFHSAVEMTIETMLQSPQFLYRDETTAQPLTVPTVSLSGFELATRLSYFLWATTPDAELLAAANAGKLDTRSGLKAEALRMLADPKSVDGLMRFFSLWLEFEAVGRVEKDLTTYSEFNPALAKAWRTSLELYVKDVMEHEGNLSTLLTSNIMYSNNAMNMYGFSAPSTSFVKNTVTNGQRIGFMGQPGFLAQHALPNGSSPIRRGVFVLDKLLCQPPPPPPAGANITPPAPSTAATSRERFTAHSNMAGCVECHRFIDPPGWTMENYDGLGRFRLTENGKNVDAKGGIVAARDSALMKSMTGLAELALALAKSAQVHQCVSDEFYRFAVGRNLTSADECGRSLVANRFLKSGGNFREMMLAIVELKSFRSNVNPEIAP